MKAKKGRNRRNKIQFQVEGSPSEPLSNGETAQQYLARYERERAEFEKARDKNDLQTERNQKALLNAVYGKELFRFHHGQKAVQLLEEIMTAISDATTYHRLGHERGKLIAEILESIGSENTHLLESKLQSSSPCERSVFEICKALRSFIHAIRTEPEEFFQNFGKACAKKRHPRNPHRAAIVYILEQKRLNNWRNFLESIRKPDTDKAEDVEFNTELLFCIFKTVLKIEPKSKKEETSAYSSFMYTLKELEDEGLIDRVPRAKTGKKPRKR